MVNNNADMIVLLGIIILLYYVCCVFIPDYIGYKIGFKKTIYKKNQKIIQVIPESDLVIHIIWMLILGFFESFIFLIIIEIIEKIIIIILRLLIDAIIAQIIGYIAGLCIAMYYIGYFNYLIGKNYGTLKDGYIVDYENKIFSFPGSCYQTEKTFLSQLTLDYYKRFFRRYDISFSDISSVRAFREAHTSNKKIKYNYSLSVQGKFGSMGCSLGVSERNRLYDALIAIPGVKGSLDTSNRIDEDAIYQISNIQNEPEWKEVWCPSNCSHCIACEYYTGSRKIGKDKEHVFYDTNENDMRNSLLCSNDNMNNGSCSEYVSCGAFKRWNSIL